MSLIFLTKYLSLLSTLTSGGGFWICLGRVSNIEAAGQKTNVWNTG